MPPFDTREKRQDVVNVAKPWIRHTYPAGPITASDIRWRRSIGNTYGSFTAGTVGPGPNVVILAVDGSCCCLPSGIPCLYCTGPDLEFDTTIELTIMGMATPADIAAPACPILWSCPDNTEQDIDFVSNNYNFATAGTHVLEDVSSCGGGSATVGGCAPVTDDFVCFEPNDQSGLFDGSPEVWWNGGQPILWRGQHCCVTKCIDICNLGTVNFNDVVHIIYFAIFPLIRFDTQPASCDVIGRLMFVEAQLHNLGEPVVGWSIIGVGYTPRIHVISDTECCNGNPALGTAPCRINCSDLNVSITSWYDRFGNPWSDITPYDGICTPLRVDCCALDPPVCQSPPNNCARFSTAPPCIFTPACGFNLNNVTATLQGF